MNDYTLQEGDVLSVKFEYEDGTTGTSTVGILGEDIQLDNYEGFTGEFEEKAEENKNFVQNVIDSVAEKVYSFVEEIIVEALLPIGDGLLYVISSSVGEITTTDSIIFNKVKKVDVDYWSTGSDSSVKSIMSGVVRRWYDVFNQIAIIVYMMVLVVAGIQILLHSTADKIAQAKEYLVSWVTGVAILFLFPYAMKYVVMLNGAAVTAISGSINYAPTALGTPDILSNKNQANEIFGTDEFVTAMAGSSDPGDTMLKTRAVLDENKSIALVVVYFILIGQMLVLLVMYYKRAFMIAFLITIFPLVAMTFAIDKMGDKKAQTFGIWFKEFIVNIIVQVFHATVYAIVVSTGIQTFISTGGKNAVFMIISVLFLFQGEKILRSIFGIESSANTIGDLAATGAVMYGAAKSLGKGGSNGNNGSEQDNKDMKGIAERNKARKGTTPPTVPAGNPKPETSGVSGAAATSAQPASEPAYDHSAAMDSVAESAMKRRMKLGLASRAVRTAGKGLGAVAGATYAMSKGDSDGKMFQNAVGGAFIGSGLGETAVSPVTATVNLAEKGISGAIQGGLISSGKLNDRIGLSKPNPDDVNPDQVIEENGESIQEIYREALAHMSRVTAVFGKSAGEMAYWNYIDKHTKK